MVTSSWISQARINERKALFPGFLLEPLVHLAHSSPEGPAGRYFMRWLLRSAHGLSCSRGAVRIEPFSGLRLAVGADLHVGTTRLVIKEIPALPAGTAIRWAFGGTILFLINQTPLPGRIFFRKAFPRLVQSSCGPMSLITKLLELAYDIARREGNPFLADDQGP